MEAKKLTKKDLWKVFRGQLTIRGANNYERQQNAGFTQAMMPVIEKVYDNDEDKREAYERHMEYFLTNDITSAIPVGIAAAMEEMHANDPDMDPNAINAVKTYSGKSCHFSCTCQSGMGRTYILCYRYEYRFPGHPLSGSISGI